MIDVKGKTVVLTGTFTTLQRKAARDALIAAGAKVTESVSAKTHMLFAGADAGSKLTKARVLGVPVYGEAELVELLGAPAPAATRAFDLPVSADAAPADLLAALDAADFASFDPARDGAALLALLEAHAARHGVTDAHRLASDKVAAHLSLAHPFGHDAEISSVELSPSGRWLATGNTFLPDDWERGGVVIVWDVRRGRAVNVLGRLVGGVGCPAAGAEHPLAWHPDEAALAAGEGDYVARLDPFGAGGGVACRVGHASFGPGFSGFDGSPPAFCWVPGTTDVCVSRYVLSTTGQQGRLVRTLDSYPDPDEGAVSNFRHQVCGYDGVLTDGIVALDAETFAPVPPRPFHDRRYGAHPLAIGLGVRLGPAPAPELAAILDRAGPLRAQTFAERTFVSRAVSPDGTHLAVLTADGRAERYRIADGALVNTVEAGWASGLQLANDTLILLSGVRIAFVDLATGATVGDHALLRPVQDHPFAEAAREMRVDPAFTLEGKTVIAVEQGFVYAPAELHAALDATLALALGRRFAWPLSWTRGRVAANLGDLAPHLPAKVAKSLTPAKKPAKPKAKPKGPPPVTTTLEQLVDRYGTHHTEALFGRPERAVERARELLRTHDNPGQEAKQVARTALRLARAGHAGAVYAFVDLLLGMPRPNWGSEELISQLEAVVRAVLAAALHAIGDVDRATALLDEALALAPSWTAPPPGPNPPAPQDYDEVAIAAALLLELGREAEAASVYANLKGLGTDEALQAAARAGDAHRLRMIGQERPGQRTTTERVIHTLLAHGHLALFDAALPAVLASPYETTFNKNRLPLARALADGIAAFDETFVALADGVQPGGVDVVQLEALAHMLSERARRSAERMPPLVAALRSALERTPAQLFENVQTWRAVRVLAELGEDVTPELDRATTAMARAHAINEVLPVASGAVRARLLALGAELDPSMFNTYMGPLQREAVRALMRAGESELATRLLLADAELSRGDADTLGAIAAIALEAGDHETAWSVLALATKAKKEQAIRRLRFEMARLGRVDAYATVCQFPAPERELQWELATLIEASAK